jgi:ornithine cyclodeaminase
MKIFQRAEIEAVIRQPEAIAAIAAGFVAYSKGEVTVPPVGYLGFTHPPGDLHIKYGHIRGDAVCVVKIATSFYDNPKLGLSSSGGLMLVFSARTGVPEVALIDGGFLTDFRTAAAGAVAAQHLAPKNLRAIGIIGAGIQARLQLDLLRQVTPCRRAIVWARDPEKARAYQIEGFTIEVAASVAELAARSNLIVTTTPANEILLRAEDVRPGTHITAVGADSPGKQELDPALFARAEVLAVDSRLQCFDHGDSSHALRLSFASRERFVELGELIADPRLARTREDQITIADLTGLAVQDIQIAKLALAGLGRNPAV